MSDENQAQPTAEELNQIESGQAIPADEATAKAVADGNAEADAATAAADQTNQQPAAAGEKANEVQGHVQALPLPAQPL